MVVIIATANHFSQPPPRPWDLVLCPPHLTEGKTETGEAPHSSSPWPQVHCCLCLLSAYMSRALGGMTARGTCATTIHPSALCEAFLCQLLSTYCVPGPQLSAPHNLAPVIITAT